jgi:hypothetical protein
MPRPRYRLLALATLTIVPWVGAVSAQQQDLLRPTVRRAPPVETLAGFVENRGQWDDEVLYFGRLNGIEATLTRDAIVLTPQRDPEATEPPPAPLVIRLPGSAAVEGVGILPTVHHFILGTGTTSWVPGYAQVIYRDVVPGIDLVLREGEDWFAYDVHVDAGVDLGALVLAFENVSNVAIADGVLVMETPSGRVEQHIGAAWEVVPANGDQVPVSSRFLLLTATENTARVGFDAPDRDPGRAFVLDPSLVWATYAGGPNQELLADLAVAGDGSTYLLAKAYPGTPTTLGAAQQANGGFSDAWIGRLSADGTTLEWGTYLGGAEPEEPVGVHLAEDGSVVVVGHTFSTDFPTTPGSLQPEFAGGNSDLFAARIAADGSAFIWSTHYGSASVELADASALYASGDILIAAKMWTELPPATPGAYDTVWDSTDQTLVRISADGTQLVFQTYFSSGTIRDIALDADSNIYLGGKGNNVVQTTPGAFQEIAPGGFGGDGFVAKLDAMGTQQLWATYLGGDKSDNVVAIAVDAASAVHVVGPTSSTDFPAMAGAFSESLGGPDSGYVAKLLPGGTGLVWATYIGGCCGGTSALFDVVVDTAGNVIGVGSSNEPNFPTTPDALQPDFIGPTPSGDAHLTKFDAFGETLVYSTYFGGSGSESIPWVSLDAAQNPTLGVRSSSSNIPGTSGTYDPSYAGGTDVVVAKFEVPLHPWKVFGGGLKGVVDTPNLAGAGALTPGSPARFSVRGAAPLSLAYLVAGLSAANLPFKGGTLVPSPTVSLPLATGGQGALDLPFLWVSVPAGLDLWVQVWIKDAGASTGWSATNALRMTSQ